MQFTHSKPPKPHISRTSTQHFRISAQLPRTQFTHSKPPNPHARKTSTQNFRISAQLPRTQLTHSKPPNPHATMTSTQNFRSSYWHSYPGRNLHTASRQSRISAGHQHNIFASRHSYPEHNLHTASRQTRMPRKHQPKIFAAPIIGTATPNAIYTHQAAKPACQEDINPKFSQLLLAQLPRTQFTHSKPPNPHARKTSTQVC